MTRSILRSAAFAVAAIVALAGCGTAAPNCRIRPGPSAPLRSGQDWRLCEAGRLPCAAKKGDFASLFGTGGGF